MNAINSTLVKSIIATRAQVAQFTARCWRATRLNKRETSKVNQDHATDAARVLVRLTNNATLVSIGKLHAEARKAHYRLTLPSTTDGLRLIPVARELEHAKLMSDYQDKHRALVAQFLAEYQTERDQAPFVLNGLYEPAQWPSADKLARKFEFSFHYLEAPTAGGWAEWLAESANAATAELRQRLAAAIAHMRDVLSKDNPKIYASLVSNLRDVVELSADLNLANDAEIEAITTAAQPLIAKPAETLRDSETDRKATAKTADEICSMFSL